MTDSDIEQEIQAKGLIAPRVTPADIEANIASEHYVTGDNAFQNNSFHIAGPAHAGSISERVEKLNLLTFCVLVLQNGFAVTGESFCTSPANFDAEIGRKIARANAVQKIWPLLQYEVRSRLQYASLPEGEPE